MTNVLVIDNDPRIRDLIGTVLLNDWVKLEYASTAQTGADLLRARRFDLAILDAMLSRISELDLPALAANENTPILFMTSETAEQKIVGRSDYSFIQKKFIKDHLPQQFAHILLESRNNTNLVKASAAKIHANTEALVNIIADSERLITKIKAERSSQAGDHAPIAEREAKDAVTQGIESRDLAETARPLALSGLKPGVTGHLGTLVRHRGFATFEICFRLEDNMLVISATRANKPVPLDFNTTVKELVALGQQIFSQSAWKLNQGNLVRSARTVT
jgi:CheY-like chemotaxis protein